MKITKGDEDVIRIKVSTEALRAAAETIDSKTNAVLNAAENLGNTIEKSAYYWEGHGQEAHIGNYRKKVARIEQAIARYRENANDLRNAAGIYDSAEGENVAAAAMLSGDLIV